MAIETFDNGARLKIIREGSLNPLITQVTKNIAPRLDTAETKISGSFNEVTLDLNTKELEFNTHGGTLSSHIQLSHIIPDEYPGVAVVGTSGSADKLKTITFKDADVVSAGVAGARVAYDWDKLVKDNQTKVSVMKGVEAPSDLRTLKFAGDLTKVDVIGGVATLTIPEANPISAQIGSQKEDVTGIILAGDTAASSITGGKLLINLNSGGGGTPLTAGNFVGFFESLGDLESEVTSPINGKSMAFVKDKTFKVPYYDAYMYINGNWTEVPNDPGVTYEPVTASEKKGVFSIKPNPAITIDANGQLNLDELAVSGNFAGFFNSKSELEKAVTKPVIDRSYGYIRMASGAYVGMRYSRNGGGTGEWEMTAPIGGTPITRKEAGGGSSTVVAYGFIENEMISVNPSTGMATITPSAGGGDFTAEIVDAHGAATSVKFNKMQFMNGSSYVAYQSSQKKLMISHPQRVIQYTEDFEDGHNDQDYKGNIFYDDNSNSWMGWATPAASGAVGKKWTHIAHEGMSTEVKGLTKRLPTKAPFTKGGTTYGDNENWEHTGWTYIEAVADKDDPSDLPDEIKMSGAYVQTYVQDVAGEAGIPQVRMQTCYEDSDTGTSQWVRRFNATPTNPGDKSWHPWVRTSFSRQDIVKHEDDPNAHRHVIKFHKATSFSAKYLDFVNQVEGATTGGVRGDNCSLLVDNYGHFNEEHDYMEPPYDNSFRVSGQLALSGYNESKKTYPIGAWKILVRIMKKGTTEWRQAGHFNYTHSDEKKKYPLLSFETVNLDLVRGDQVIININFDNNGGIRNNHPDLYFAPVRSFFVLEDKNTHAGSRIAHTFSKCIANVDTMGDVGVRVHHATPTNPNTNIRVYGEVVSHIPVVMDKI